MRVKAQDEIRVGCSKKITSKKDSVIYQMENLELIGIKKQEKQFNIENVKILYF